MAPLLQLLRFRMKMRFLGWVGNIGDAASPIMLRCKSLGRFGLRESIGLSAIDAMERAGRFLRFGRGVSAVVAHLRAEARFGVVGEYRR